MQIGKSLVEHFLIITILKMLLVNYKKASNDSTLHSTLHTHTPVV